MAIEDIVRALDEQADAESRELVENARLHAKTVAAEASEEAKRIRARKVGEAEARVKTKAAQTINAAKLENKRDLSALKGQAIASVFEDATGSLRDLRSSRSYADLFRGLAKEALLSVDGAVEVAIDPRDEKLSRQVLDEAGVEYKLRPELESSGGLVVITGEGRISRRNTLEDRLAKVRHIAQSQVAEILFE